MFDLIVLLNDFLLQIRVSVERVSEPGIREFSILLQPYKNALSTVKLLSQSLTLGMLLH